LLEKNQRDASPRIKEIHPFVQKSTFQPLKKPKKPSQCTPLQPLDYSDRMKRHEMEAFAQLLGAKPLSQTERFMVKSGKCAQK